MGVKRFSGGMRDADADAAVAATAREQRLSRERLYETRSDKDWSLTDCLSFTLMERYQNSNALTSDHYFAQAGFRAVLLEAPGGE